MDEVAERMLGRLSGRGAAGAAGGGDVASKRSVVERALARTQGVLRPSRDAGSSTARGPALLDRLMERLDETELMSSPWLDFSVRPPVGTQAFSGDAVVYVDLSETSPVDAFVDEPADMAGAPRKAKPGESVTRAVSGWGSKPKAAPPTPLRRAFGRVRRPSDMAAVERAARGGRTGAGRTTRLLDVLDVLADLSPSDREQVTERLLSDIGGLPDWAQRAGDASLQPPTPAKRAEARLAAAAGRPSRSVLAPSRSGARAGGSRASRGAAVPRAPRVPAGRSADGGAGGAGPSAVGGLLGSDQVFLGGNEDVWSELTARPDVQAPSGQQAERGEGPLARAAERDGVTRKATGALRRLMAPSEQGFSLLPRLPGASTWSRGAWARDAEARAEVPQAEMERGGVRPSRVIAGDLVAVAPPRAEREEAPMEAAAPRPERGGRSASAAQPSKGGTQGTTQGTKPADAATGAGRRAGAASSVGPGPGPASGSASGSASGRASGSDSLGFRPESGAASSRAPSAGASGRTGELAVGRSDARVSESEASGQVSAASPRTRQAAAVHAAARVAVAQGTSRGVVASPFAGPRQVERASSGASVVRTGGAAQVVREGQDERTAPAALAFGAGPARAALAGADRPIGRDDASVARSAAPLASAARGVRPTWRAVERLGEAVPADAVKASQGAVARLMRDEPEVAALADRVEGRSELGGVKAPAAARRLADDARPAAAASGPSLVWAQPSEGGGRVEEPSAAPLAVDRAVRRATATQVERDGTGQARTVPSPVAHVASERATARRAGESPVRAERGRVIATDSPRDEGTTTDRSSGAGRVARATAELPAVASRYEAAAARVADTSAVLRAAQDEEAEFTAPEAAPRAERAGRAVERATRRLEAASVAEEQAGGRLARVERAAEVSDAVELAAARAEGAVVGGTRAARALAADGVLPGLSPREPQGDAVAAAPDRAERGERATRSDRSPTSVERPGRTRLNRQAGVLTGEADGVDLLESGAASGSTAVRRAGANLAADGAGGATAGAEPGIRIVTRWSEGAAGGATSRMLRISGRDQASALRDVVRWRREALPELLSLVSRGAGNVDNGVAEAAIDALVGGSTARPALRGASRAAARIGAAAQVGRSSGASAGSQSATSGASAVGAAPGGAAPADRPTRSTRGRSSVLGAAMRGETAPTALLASSLEVQPSLASGMSSPAAAWTGDVRGRGDMAGYGGRWLRPAAAGDEAAEPGQILLPRPRSGALDRPELAWLAGRPAEQLHEAPEMARAIAAIRGRGGSVAGQPGATSAPRDPAARTASGPVEGVFADGAYADGGASAVESGAVARRAGRRGDEARRGAAADGMPGAGYQGAVFARSADGDASGDAGGSPLASRSAPALSARGSTLLRALTRASGVDQVIELMGDHGAEAAEVASVLPEPAARVLREIGEMRTLPDASVQLLSGPAQSQSASAGGASSVASHGGGRRSQGSTTRRVRGSGASAGSSATSTDGVGANRLMKLSSKLLGLIHLAEVERMADEAARQVRRSDEKVEATSTARAGQTEAAEGVTLASLQREVLEAVQREIEMMRDRGEGGRHGDFWW